MTDEMELAAACKWCGSNDRAFIAKRKGTQACCPCRQIVERNLTAETVGAIRTGIKKQANAMSEDLFLEPQMARSADPGRKRNEGQNRDD